jgi:hypothetical protein
MNIQTTKPVRPEVKLEFRVVKKRIQLLTSGLRGFIAYAPLGTRVLSTQLEDI